MHFLLPLVFVALSVAFRVEQPSPEVLCFVAEFDHPFVGVGYP